VHGRGATRAGEMRSATSSPPPRLCHYLAPPFLLLLCAVGVSRLH